MYSLLLWRPALHLLNFLRLLIWKKCIDSITINDMQALRDIQSSPYAKKVFEQIKTQEQTKQQELKVKEAEYKAAAERAAIVRVACLCNLLAVYLVVTKLFLI